LYAKRRAAQWNAALQHHYSPFDHTVSSPFDRTMTQAICFENGDCLQALLSRACRRRKRKQ
jgi:hypothetical protein